MVGNSAVANRRRRMTVVGPEPTIIAMLFRAPDVQRHLYQSILQPVCFPPNACRSPVMFKDRRYFLWWAAFNPIS